MRLHGLRLLHWSLASSKARSWTKSGQCLPRCAVFFFSNVFLILCMFLCKRLKRVYWGFWNTGLYWISRSQILSDRKMKAWLRSTTKMLEPMEGRMCWTRLWPMAFLWHPHHISFVFWVLQREHTFWREGGLTMLEFTELCYKRMQYRWEGWHGFFPTS